MTGRGFEPVERPWWVALLLVVAGLVALAPIVFAGYAVGTTPDDATTPSSTTPTVPPRTTTTGVPRPTAAQRAMVERARLRTGLPVFHDDFTDVRVGWKVGAARDGSTSSYVTDGFEIRPGDDVAALATPFGVVAHTVAVSATASLPADAGDDTGVGIACTYSSDGSDDPSEAISFEVFADGTYRLASWGLSPNEELDTGSSPDLGTSPVVTLFCTDAGPAVGLTVVGFVGDEQVTEFTVPQEVVSASWGSSLLASGPAGVVYTDLVVSEPQYTAPDEVPAVLATDGTPVLDQDLRDPENGWEMIDTNSFGFGTTSTAEGIRMVSGKNGGWLGAPATTRPDAFMVATTAAFATTDPPAAMAGVGCRQELADDAAIHFWFTASTQGRWSLDRADVGVAEEAQPHIRAGSSAPTGPGGPVDVRLACVALPHNGTTENEDISVVHLVGFVGGQQVLDVLTTIPGRDAVRWHGTLETGDTEAGQFTITFSHFEQRNL